jgi:hypothetical protein
MTALIHVFLQQFSVANPLQLADMADMDITRESGVHLMAHKIISNLSSGGE